MREYVCRCVGVVTPENAKEEQVAEGAKIAKDNINIKTKKKQDRT